MQRMLETARLERPPIQRLADRIAAAFVPGVVLLATGVFAWQAWAGRPEAGLFSALSVVLISCPCALGLAAPLACWNALRRAAGQGIVIDSAVTLERLSRISRIFFDKTGTLTESEPVVASIEPSEGLDAGHLLGLSAALESACLHPVARGLIREARERGVNIPEAVHVTVHPGLGVEGEVEGRVYGLGGTRFLESRGIELPGNAETVEGIAVYLFDGEKILAAIELAEELRPDAGQAVSTVTNLGIAVEILTGDRAAPAARIGRLLGIPVSGELLPGDKLARLTAARENGACVAMVGDGINDGPVLAAADVGIATGSATDLARQAGNVRLIGDRLDRVPLTLAISRDCMRRIRFNLAWAFGYNGIGITLAALGLLSPIFAASAMFVSSLVIVMVSRRAGCVEQARMEP
jgi:Cu+-exporting ATPase